MPNQNIHVNVNTNDIQVAVDVIAPQKKKLNIFDAVKERDFNEIKTYVNAGGDVNVKNKEGLTPLMQAMQNNWKASEIKMMLDNMPGVNLKLYAIYENTANPNYGKPLDMAIKQGNFEVAKVLLNYAGIVSIGNEIFSSPLQANPEFFKIVLSHLKYNNYQEAHGHLINSMSTKNFETFETILSKVKVISENHQHPLLQHAALYANDKHCIDLLIDKKYVGTYAIQATMYNLAKHDQSDMFAYISSKNIDHKSVFDFITKYKENIPKYHKYSELLGIKLFEEEPGTIYLSDVLEGSNENEVKFNDNDSIHVNVNICNNNGMCIQVKVDAGQLPALQNIEGIILA